jgi:RimJ/RimL family protein N-acetyltransferase
MPLPPVAVRGRVVALLYATAPTRVGRYRRLVRIREADDRDGEAMAQLLLAADDARVVSANGLRYSLRTLPKRARLLVLVVEAEDAVVAVGSVALNTETTTEGAAWAFVTVDEANRRKGIGDELGRRLLDYLREVGATKCTSFFRWTEDGDQWATARGWSRLTTQPLIAVDPRTVPEPSIPAGYRCVPMAEVAPERVYEAVRVAALDEPTPIPQDDFRIDDFLREWNEPDTDLRSSTAVLADDGTVVAFTRLKVAGKHAQQGFTGTVRDHRGRGLATAAKCWALRTAAASGVTRVTTSNAEENAAMRAINRKLGFEAIGDHVIFGRDL